MCPKRTSSCIVSVVRLRINFDAINRAPPDATGMKKTAAGIWRRIYGEHFWSWCLARVSWA